MAKTEVSKDQGKQIVTGVFQNCGVSFENPTKEGVITAVNQCKDNAEGMMGERVLTSLGIITARR